MTAHARFRPDLSDRMTRRIVCYFVLIADRNALWRAKIGVSRLVTILKNGERTAQIGIIKGARNIKRAVSVADLNRVIDPNSRVSVDMDMTVEAKS